MQTAVIRRLEWVAALAIILLLRTAEGATLVVTNNNNSGPGSLRQAILDNGTMGGGNTITFSNVTGAITLGSELLISNNVTVLGPGANVLVVNGNASSRVFDITNAIVTISGLTISNGWVLTFSGNGYGAGISSMQSTVSLSNCVVSGNYGFGGGGGIFNNNSALTLSRCTVSDNATFYDGGGLFNAVGFGTSTVSVVECTFSGNLATNFGARGGAIYNNATLSVVASTFSGNSSGYVDTGDIDNEGGSVTLGDTILKADNSGSITNNSGTFTSLGYNISSDGGGGVLTATGDQINTDPMLGPLQDNGGPTWTCLPLAGSPAIDQGRNLAHLPTDQRGFCRVYDDPAIANASGGDGSDIGAVEISGPHTTIVTTNGDGAGTTLRYCLCDAQPGDIITFSNNVTGAITLNNGTLLINKNLTIQGPGSNVLAINGNAASLTYPSVDFYVLNSVATISGLTISNGNGGIYSYDAALTVSNCNITGNSAPAGGGIYNNANGGSGTLTVIGSTISGNSADSLGDGGGIYNDGQGGNAKLNLIGSTITGNSATNGGGGIYNSIDDLSGTGGGGTATVTVTASTVSGNAASFGGGIETVDATVSATGSTVSSNTATNSGGGIYISGPVFGQGTASVTNSTISGNTAWGNGGGIYNNGTLTIIAGTISSNVAETPFQPAGGIFNGGSGLEIGNSILKTGVHGANIVAATGTILSDGYNLSSDAGGGYLTAPGDQINTDPMIGPLQNNGGPTFTHAISFGSPALDKGKSFGLATDQRGASRPVKFASTMIAPGGDGSDIGAFELGWPQLNIQQAGTNVVLSWLSSYAGFSLQSSTNIALSNSWITASGSAGVVGTQYEQTNGPISGNLFFRLREN